MFGPGNELDMQSTLLPENRGRPSTAGMVLVVFAVVLFAVCQLITWSFAEVSRGVALTVGLAIALAGGAGAYRRERRIEKEWRAREAERIYEMQRNRVEEAEKQIAEMKRKAAKAEGTE